MVKEEKSEEEKEQVVEEPKKEFPKVTDGRSEDETSSDETSSDETSKDETDTGEVSAIGDGGGVYQIDVDTGSSTNWGKIVVIVLAIVILIASAGGVWYFFMKDNQQERAVDASKTPAVVEEKMEATEGAVKKEESKDEAATEETKIEDADLADYKVQVLNGSGTAGEAGVVEGLLEDAGFEGVDTGNADSYDYEDTQVQLKDKTAKAVYTAIEDALSDDYNVKKGDSLNEDSDFDVVVIVGQRS